MATTELINVDEKVVGISKFGGSILALPLDGFADAKCYIMQ